MRLRAGALRRWIDALKNRINLTENPNGSMPSGIAQGLDGRLPEVLCNLRDDLGREETQAIRGQPSDEGRQSVVTVSGYAIAISDS